jgi:hypothetical protein
MPPGISRYLMTLVATIEPPHCGHVCACVSPLSPRLARAVLEIFSAIWVSLHFYECIGHKNHKFYGSVNAGSIGKSGILPHRPVPDDFEEPKNRTNQEARRHLSDFHTAITKISTPATKSYIRDPMSQPFIAPTDISSNQEKFGAILVPAFRDCTRDQKIDRDSIHLFQCNPQRRRYQ